MAVAIQKIAVYIALILLSHLPYLVVAENWTSYRSAFALTSTSLFLAFCSAAYWISSFRDARLRGLIFGTVTIIVTIACLQTVSMIHRSFIQPQTAEYSFVKFKIRTADLKGIKYIHVIRPKPFEVISAVSYQDEYGVPSSFQEWSSPAMVTAALRESGLDASAITVSSSLADEVPERPDGTLMIDMRDLKYLR